MPMSRSEECWICCAHLPLYEWAAHQRSYHAPASDAPCQDCPFRSPDLSGRLVHGLLEGHALPSSTSSGLSKTILPLLTDKSVRGKISGLSQILKTTKSSATKVSKQKKTPSKRQRPPESVSDLQPTANLIPDNQEPPSPDSCWTITELDESPTEEVEMVVEDEEEVSVLHSLRPQTRSCSSDLPPPISPSLVKADSNGPGHLRAEPRLTMECGVCEESVGFTSVAGRHRSAITHARICQGIHTFVCSFCRLRADKAQEVRRHIRKECAGAEVVRVKESDPTVIAALKRCFPTLSD